MLNKEDKIQDLKNKMSYVEEAKLKLQDQLFQLKSEYVELVAKFEINQWVIDKATPNRILIVKRRVLKLNMDGEFLIKYILGIINKKHREDSGLYHNSGIAVEETELKEYKDE